MKIAIATPILFDPSSPFNHLFKDLIGEFLKAGFQVVRFVATRDLQEEDYKFEFDSVEYVKFIRRESNHGNIITRFFRDSVTNIREARALIRSDADILFEDISYSSFWPVKAAKKKGMRVIAMLQDVWPDNAVQSGLIKKNGFLYKFFDVWQQFVYRESDRIICISDDMKSYMVSKGIDEKKIEVIYNWGYSDETVNISWDENEFVRKYKLVKDFYAVYAGNIGKMQNVELIIRAAKKMPDTKFLIIGDGAKREEIARMAAELNNVTMYPLQPSKLAEHIYSMAGVNIIPLVEGGPQTAMPSKTGVVLSCGQPVIFCFGAGTEFAKKVKQFGAGISVSATDEEELVEAINWFRHHEKATKNYELFKSQFLRSKNLERYSYIVRESRRT